MRKQIQIDKGNGWRNLNSVFYERGNAKSEADAQKRAEQMLSQWPVHYYEFRDAAFRIIDVG